MIEKILKQLENNSPYINGWENMKRASVAIMMVRDKGEDYILFEVRSKKMRSQPGDIAFPGGKIDSGESPKDAVIREIEEELGLEENDFEIIAPLDLCVTHYDLLIHPFIGYINNLDNIKINENEVDKVFLVPIEFLIKNKPLIYENEVIVKRNKNFPYNLINQGKEYKFKSGKYPSIFYIYNEYVIWGLTAKIIENFIARILKDNIIK